MILEKILNHDLRILREFVFSFIGIFILLLLLFACQLLHHKPSKLMLRKVNDVCVRQQFFSEHFLVFFLTPVKRSLNNVAGMPALSVFHQVSGQHVRDSFLVFRAPFLHDLLHDMVAKVVAAQGGHSVIILQDFFDQFHGLLVTQAMFGNAAEDSASIAVLCQINCSFHALFDDESAALTVRHLNNCLQYKICMRVVHRFPDLVFEFLE
mmetsp:Transcript_74215/g.143683  ORF Transcript_74215/g.143683 Transcript_74215/m.143683 type:complete len:209 (+) Transcript_74215:555-1181(+)